MHASCHPIEEMRSENAISRRHDWQYMGREVTCPVRALADWAGLLIG